ncbi:MAG: NnrS family protein [Burkholderiales bacterium]|nr:NnrS family protein [Burkholderiales bacterium]MDE2394843.1 NnrS family protein [Burkholderiales bacterium]MDE2456150.1 NnrS family protein [Burkholderiales bacterium]
MSTPNPTPTPIAAPIPTPRSIARRAGQAPGWPLLRLGFRPFYLGAALFAALAVPLWVAIAAGLVAPRLALPPLLWHAHEMIFGFAVAVIAGFLLTAARAWTGLATLRGRPLAALALLWLAARIAAFAAPSAVYAVLDLLFLPCVALAFGVVLLRAGNRRNLPLVGLLLLLAAANACFHLAAAGRIALDPMRALFAALGLVVLVECVITGRVVAVFTVNAVPSAMPRRWPRLEAATVAATALGLAWWVALPPGPIGAALLVLAALLHLARWAAWNPWATRHKPILWILHVSVLWIPVGCVLLALAQLGWLTESAGVHAFAVGATGGLVVGMLTRTARGHTGRPLKASRLEVAAYAAIVVAALLRVGLPLVEPAWREHAWACSAAAWSGAFGLYLFVFTPWLLRARLDGKDG